MLASYVVYVSTRDRVDVQQSFTSYDMAYDYYRVMIESDGVWQTVMRGPGGGVMHSKQYLRG